MSDDDNESDAEGGDLLTVTSCELEYEMVSVLVRDLRKKRVAVAAKIVRLSETLRFVGRSVVETERDLEFVGN